VPLDRLTKLDPLQLGRFRILARLGGGGMGNVYLAEADDGAPAAVKVIRAELAQDTQFRARFRREVEAGRRVHNRGIARYLDADTFAASPWLATEFVPGRTLHHEVLGHGPVIGRRVLGLGAGLADALVAVHAAGLVHRDLKPANVLLAPDAPKIIDFGISLAVDATALTTTGTLVGSPAYMSPEQARGVRDVGPAADVFSWASCMTFASRREPPFGEGEAAGLLYKVVHEQPDLTGLDPALLPLVLAALDKDPANRPTAIELVAALTAVLDGHPAASLMALPRDGGPARVVAPLAGANAGRVLAATWAPDHRALEEAEATLVEARELRAGLPPRAEERSRRDRIRAKRAVFASMLIALVAMAVVGIITVRPGRTELAKPADNGKGPDPSPTTGGPPSTTAPPSPSASTTVTGYVPVPPGPGPGAGVVAPAGSTTAPTVSGPTTPTGAPTTSVAVSQPPVTAGTTCSAQLVTNPPANPPDQLPTYRPGSPESTYRLRVTAASGSGATLTLVRADGSPAWSTSALGGASPFDVGPFAMLVGPGNGPPGATTHREVPPVTFTLQLRTPDRTVPCGSFRA